MAIDLSDDYKTVDLYEPVTLVSRSTAPATHDEEREVTHAFRGALTYRELAATSGAAVRMEAAFDIPKKLINDYVWKPGDTLTDQNDNLYNIFNAQVDPGTAFWRFIVYNPKIAYDLRHTIDVYDYTMAKDASGAAYKDGEHLLYEDISCRVQWQTVRPGKFADRTGEDREAIIYSSQRLYLTHNSVIEWADPDTNEVCVFDVESWSMTDRLDELMQIAVRLKP